MYDHAFVPFVGGVDAQDQAWPRQFRRHIELRLKATILFCAFACCQDEVIGPFVIGKQHLGVCSCRGRRDCLQIVRDAAHRAFQRQPRPSAGQALGKFPAHGQFLTGHDRVVRVDLDILAHRR